MGSNATPLRDIDIGEPDANAEFFSYKRKGEEPLFLQSFYLTESFPLNDFLNGSKYIIYGHKGTGKTATLRYIDMCLNKDRITNFMIFKKAIIDEVDISSFSKVPLLLDEERVKAVKHYHHAIKRILIFIMLGMISATKEEDDGKNEAVEDEKQSGILKKSIRHQYLK